MTRSRKYLGAVAVAACALFAAGAATQSQAAAIGEGLVMYFQMGGNPGGGATLARTNGARARGGSVRRRPARAVFRLAARQDDRPVQGSLGGQSGLRRDHGAPGQRRLLRSGGRRPRARHRAHEWQLPAQRALRRAPSIRVRLRRHGQLPLGQARRGRNDQERGSQGGRPRHGVRPAFAGRARQARARRSRCLRRKQHDDRLPRDQPRGERRPVARRGRSSWPISSAIPM